MLREVLKLIVYKYCAFLNLPGNIHKYIWNVVINYFTIFQNYFSEKIVLLETNLMKTSPFRNSVKTVDLLYYLFLVFN